MEELSFSTLIAVFEEMFGRSLFWLLLGGALCDEAGRMTGSMMVLNLPDEAAVRAWIAQDPYTAGDVWRDVTVTPFRPAQLPYQPLPRD